MLPDEGLVFTVDRLQLLTADFRIELAVVTAQYAHNKLSKGGLAEGTACHARFIFFPLLDREYGRARSRMRLEKWIDLHRFYRCRRLKIVNLCLRVDQEYC